MTATPNASPRVPQDRLWWFMSSCLVVLSALIGYVVLVNPLPDGYGTQHVTFKTMAVGGDPSRHASPVVWIGMTYLIVQVLFLVSSLCLGATRGKIRNVLITVTVISTIWLAGVVGLFVLYSHELHGMQQLEVTWGFTKSTAWMLFVIWPTPILFIATYCIKFRDWFYTEDDQSRFEEILTKSVELTDTGSAIAP